MDLAVRKSKAGQIIPTSFASTRQKTIYSIQDVRSSLKHDNGSCNIVENFKALIPPVHYNEFLNN